MEYKAECPICPEIYVSDTRWFFCPVHGAPLVPYSKPQKSDTKRAPRPMLLMFDLPRPSASTLPPTLRVFRESKHIATVTRGVIRPKRRLTKEERAGIVAFVETSA